MSDVPCDQTAQPEANQRLSAAAAIDLSWPAEPATVSRVRSAIRRFAAEHGADDDLTNAMALAVSEAATNAVVHAFVGRPPGTVRLVARTGAGELIVHVRDDGRGMVPRTDSPGLGIGLSTIGTMADRLDITEPDDGGTHVRMVFRAPWVRGVGEPGSDGEARMRLLVEVARLASGSGWPAEGVESMAALLAPALADVCTIDVLDEAGELRRLAARVSADPELSAWLAERPPAPEDARPPMLALEDGPQVLEYTAELMQATARDESDLQQLRRLGTRWWVTVPLREQERTLGLLNLGLTAGRDRPSEADIEYYVQVGERAGRGLANTQLLEEMRRTRRRLEQILGALSEAVTVNDAEGETVYANAAAVRLLGMESVEQLLGSEPGEIAARFRITREDGSPVPADELPGLRLVSGREAPPLLTRSVHLASGREYWLLTKASLLDGEELLAVNIIEDVTEQKLVERRHRFLARASRHLIGRPAADMPQRVAELAVEELADWCTIDLLADGLLRRVGLANRDPDKLTLARQMDVRWPPTGEPSARARQLLEGGPAIVVSHMTDALLAGRARDAEHLRLLKEIGIRAVVVAPLRTAGETLGMLTLVSAESARRFDAADRDFICDVAERVAVALRAGASGG